MKKLRVTVDGKAYEVLVELLDSEETQAEVRRPARPASATVASAAVSAPTPTKVAAQSAAAGPGEVPSPLAGKVVSIEVEPGQQVEANQQLITLEAMKMNTYIFAPTAGTVESILVQPGDAVEEGQALVKIS
ncbi:MAG: biotin/lipoyl-containing protein [Chthoniobacterales bacterium]